jgi:chromosome segregation ATPase
MEAMAKSRAPVPPTCSDINHYIKVMNEAFEYLRTSNGALRDWGEGLADDVDDLQGRLSDAEDTIADLNREIEGLKAELKEVQILNERP